MQSETEHECFQQAEAALKTKIPAYLKNLLIANGYDSELVLSSINEADITSIENFSKTSLLEHLSKHAYKDYYGPIFSNDPTQFQIVKGHRTLIFLIRDYFKQKIQTKCDKATTTDMTSETESIAAAVLINNRKNSNNVTSFSSHGSCSSGFLKKENDKIISEVNLTEENTNIYKNLKKWAESKTTKEQWAKIKFDDIKFETSISSSKELICTVTCFCGKIYKLPKSSKKETHKPKWMYSSYQSHFMKMHAHSQALKTCAESENKITKYLLHTTDNSIASPSGIKVLHSVSLKNFVPVLSSVENDTKETLKCQENSDTGGDIKSKWSCLKYSRAERSRRKRESLHENQSLLTSFFPVIQEMICAIDKNPDIGTIFNETVSRIQAENRESPEELTKNIFLNTLFEASLNNTKLKNRNSHDDCLKKFSLYLYYVGGRLLYETLHANLNGILPSISTLYRFSANNFNKTEEGEFNFKGLNDILEERELPKVVWIAEDSTRITGKIEYNPLTNKVMGFVLPLENGIPNINKYIAKSAKDIENYFSTAPKCDYAYVVMAQHVGSETPAFCLSVFGTDNKFTYKDILMRWTKMQEAAQKFGIKILGYSSDGDTRLLKAMKIATCLPSSSSSDLKTWFHMDVNKTSVCYVQDQVHVLTKLRTRFLKPGVHLPMGNFIISVEHLRILIETWGKDTHLITKSDLIPEDKMNYESAKKICDNKVINLLSEIPESAATKLYLKMMNFLIASFINKNENVTTRLYYIWYVIFLLRIWRRWLKNSSHKLQDNFITSNCYTCIELNGHMLIKLIKRFQEDQDLHSSPFCLYLFNSQHCERLFRSSRSITSTYSTKINFSIKDFVSRIDRISFINSVVTDLKDKFVFPRERNKEGCASSCTCTDTINDLDDIKIEQMVNNALEDAFNDAANIGMLVDKNSCYILDIAMNVDMEEEDQTIDECIQAKDCDIENNNMFNAEQIIQNDIILEDKVEENTLQNDIHLKDYSDKNVDLSESSPYLKLYLPGNKTAVIKKSAYCWLLEEGNGRVSNDRLKRFIIQKRRKNAEGKSQKSKKPKKNPVDEISDDSIIDNDQNICYDDSTDTECFSSGDETETTEVENETVEIFLEKYYCVLYEEQWFIGRILSDTDNSTYLMKFLKEDVGSYVWPKMHDVAKVDKKYIFFGPVDLMGSEPFQIKRSDILKINKRYKCLKKSLLS